MLDATGLTGKMSAALHDFHSTQSRPARLLPLTGGIDAGDHSGKARWFLPESPVIFG
jgi:hypothetical protein